MQETNQKILLTPEKFFIKFFLNSIIPGIIIGYFFTILGEVISKQTGIAFIKYGFVFLVSLLIICLATKKSFKYNNLKKRDINKVLIYFILVFLLPSFIFLGLNIKSISSDAKNSVLEDSTLRISILYEGLENGEISIDDDEDTVKKYTENKLAETLDYINTQIISTIIIGVIIGIISDVLIVLFLRYLLIKNSIDSIDNNAQELSL